MSEGKSFRRVRMVSVVKFIKQINVGAKNEKNECCEIFCEIFYFHRIFYDCIEAHSTNLKSTLFYLNLRETLTQIFRLTKEEETTSSCEQI